MAIGMPVNMSWAFTEEAKDAGTIKKGWYRVKGKKVDEPRENEKHTRIIPFSFTIVSDTGGFKGQTLFHNFCAPGEGWEGEDSTRGMWSTDQRNFLTAALPGITKAAAEAVNLDKIEGMELWAYLEPDKEYQGRRKPRVSGGRWAGSLPEGAAEGPATA